MAARGVLGMSQQISSSLSPIPFHPCGPARRTVWTRKKNGSDNGIFIQTKYATGTVNSTNSTNTAQHSPMCERTNDPVIQGAWALMEAVGNSSPIVGAPA